MHHWNKYIGKKINLATFRAAFRGWPGPWTAWNYFMAVPCLWQCVQIEAHGTLLYTWPWVKIHNAEGISHLEWKTSSLLALELELPSRVEGYNWDTSASWCTEPYQVHACRNHLSRARAQRQRSAPFRVRIHWSATRRCVVLPRPAVGSPLLGLYGGCIYFTLTAPGVVGAIQ